MNRWLLTGSMLGLLVFSTGCLHHNTRGGCKSCLGGAASSDCGCNDCGGGDCGSGSCGTCSTGSCTTGSCNTGSCGTASCSCGNHRMGGLLNKARGRIAGCNAGCGRIGCQAGPLGWQQGGLDYSSQLNPGFLGHNAANAVQSQPFTPGAPTAQVAYPYYSHRGPRDFLLANPPSIGP